VFFDANSATSAGMAGASIASGDDALDQTDNPASLSFAPTGIDLNVLYLRTSIDYHNAGTFAPGTGSLAGTPFRNDASAASGFSYFPFTDNNAFAPSLGAVFHLTDATSHAGFFWLRDLSLGLSMFGAGGDAARFRLDHPVLGPDTLFRTNEFVAVGAASVAYRFGDWLSVGASLQGNGARLRIEQPSAFQSSQLAAGANPLLTLFGAKTFGNLFQELGASESWATIDFGHPGLALSTGGRLGVQIRPVEGLSVGVTYQTGRKFNFKGTTRLDFTDQVNDVNARVLTNPTNSPKIHLLQEVLAFFYGALTPKAVEQGFSLLGVDQSLGFVQTYETEIPLSLPQEISVGVAYALLAEWRVEVDYTWINWSRALRSFEVHFRNGTNPNINLLAGSPNVDYVLPFRWSDQHVIAVGTSYVVNDRLTLRTGYSFATEPIHGRGHILTLPAGGFQSVALGGSVRLTDSLVLSLALEHAFRETISTGHSDIWSFGDNSSESTSEFSAHLQLGIRFGAAPSGPLVTGRHRRAVDSVSNARSAMRHQSQD
jgi:long-subunit fatty acid transport protein